VTYNFWNEAQPISRIEKMLRHDPTELLRRTVEMPADAITVGESLATGLDVRLSPKANLSVHCHVVGATGVGKTFWMEGVLKHLIAAGHGLCVITPHDELYRRLMRYCAYLHMEKPQLRLAERVIPFDIDDTRRVIGFNPVARNARVLTYQVIALIESIRKVWGQDSFQDTPRLARWLFNAAYAVVEPGLTMIQAQRLVDNKPHPLREAIVRRIQNDDIRAEWQSVMNPRLRQGKDDVLESAFNRIRAFTSNELIRQMLGQYTKTLDVPAVLRDRKIMLVNLDARNAMGDDNRRLLGTLLVNELMAAAFARKEGHRTPFFVAIDEFSHFATKDICEVLDGGRKYGLHLILAHQLLHQLKENDPEVYYSTMTNARTKVVFGGLMDEDLDVLARELYVGELDPDEVKDEVWQTKYDPVETSRIVASQSESEGGSESYSEISHESLVTSESYMLGEDGVIQPMPAAMGTAAGEGQASGRSYGSSWSRACSEARVPFYEYHAYSELSSRTFRSLDEQLYIKKAQLKRQPRQHAALLIPGRRVELMRTPDLREFRVAERQVDDFKFECWESAGCFARPDDAEAEIAAMEARLLSPPVIDIVPTPIDREADNNADDDNDFDRV
jgi:hypothetical protein